MLPLGNDPSLSNQGVALGVMLLGSEADRSAIALNEFEPAAGVIVLSCRRARPDFYRSVRRNNALLIPYLRGLRMPGPRGRSIVKYFPSGGWESEEIQMDDVVADTARCLSQVVAAASEIHAPVIMFPFGPKIVVFATSLYLALQYPEASWAVYPVANTHLVNYSDGSDRTEWYRADELVNALGVTLT